MKTQNKIAIVLLALYLAAQTCLVLGVRGPHVSSDRVVGVVVEVKPVTGGDLAAVRVDDGSGPVWYAAPIRVVEGVQPGDLILAWSETRLLPGNEVSASELTTIESLAKSMR